MDKAYYGVPDLSEPVLQQAEPSPGPVHDGGPLREDGELLAVGQPGLVPACAQLLNKGTSRIRIRIILPYSDLHLGLRYPGPYPSYEVCYLFDLNHTLAEQNERRYRVKEIRHHIYNFRLYR
jgi:hypothetical protein